VVFSEQQVEATRRAIADFKRAMELRGDLNLRVARRVTAILRTGMFSFAVITVIMVGMLIAFTSSVKDMIVVMDTMRVQFSSMADNMRVMREVIARMDRDMATLPVVTAELNTMREHVSRMNGELAAMTQKVAAVEGNLQVITTNVGQLNDSFRQVEPALADIGRNVNQASGPVKNLNSFMPW